MASGGGLVLRAKGRAQPARLARVPSVRLTQPSQSRNGESDSNVKVKKSKSLHLARSVQISNCHKRYFCEQTMQKKEYSHFITWITSWIEQEATAPEVPEYRSWSKRVLSGKKDIDGKNMLIFLPRKPISSPRVLWMLLTLLLICKERRGNWIMSFAWQNVYE